MKRFHKYHKEINTFNHIIIIITQEKWMNQRSDKRWHHYGLLGLRANCACGLFGRRTPGHDRRSDTGKAARAAFYWT